MQKRTLILWIGLVVVASFLFVSTNIDAIHNNICDMKTHIFIEFKSEGGIAFIPRLNQPATVDSNNLSHEQVDELRRLIEEAKFFELPGNIVAPSSGAADYQKYTIIIEEDGHRHRVEYTDLVDNPALKKLFTFLKSAQSDQQ